MQRYFFSINLPPIVSLKLKDICVGLPNAKWEEPSNMHITLQFLGEVEESKIESFRTHAKKVQVSSFHLEVSELGQFPSNKNPQILWAGIKLVDEVKNLKNELVKHLSVLADLSNDHDFIPHITLARLKKTPKDILDGFYANHINFSVSSFPVNEFYLMRSELSSKGSIYKVVEAFPLNVKS